MARIMTRRKAIPKAIELLQCLPQTEEVVEVIQALKKYSSTPLDRWDAASVYEALDEWTELKRQGRRTDLTLVQVEPKLKKRWAAEMVGTEVGETMSTIKRYIRLTYLSNYLLEFVDKNELPFTVAVDLCRNIRRNGLLRQSVEI